MVLSRTTGWIGVDIGTQAIKLAQVARRGPLIELVEALCVRRQTPWPAPAESKPDVPSDVELQAALALGRRFRGCEAAVTLPMAVCDLRSCVVSGTTDVERRATIARELDALDNHPSGPREFDYWTVDSPAENPSHGEHAIALSIPRFWADRVTQDLRRAGLSGRVLDGLPLAAARAVALPTSQPTGLIAAVDWGHSSATLCLVKAGRPLFVRNLRDCGYRHVSDALCTALAVTPDESQQLLHDHGLTCRDHESPTDIQQVIEDIARPSLDRFVDELHRTTDYLAHQRRGMAPAKVVLLGGGATVRNVASYLEAQIGLPVQTWALDAATRRSIHQHIPIEIFGPAIALSCLAWSAR